MVDSSKIEGVAEEAIGTVQENMGGLLGDGASQIKGKAKQVAGQAKGYYGDSLDTVRDITADQPLIALLVATLLGFVFGALLARR